MLFGSLSFFLFKKKKKDWAILAFSRGGGGTTLQHVSRINTNEICHLADYYIHYPLPQAATKFCGRNPFSNHVVHSSGGTSN